MKAAFLPAVEALKSGDPRCEDTFIGPLISEKEAKRVEEWIQEAVDAGAACLSDWCCHYSICSWEHPESQPLNPGRRVGRAGRAPSGVPAGHLWSSPVAARGSGAAARSPKQDPVVLGLLAGRKASEEAWCASSPPAQPHAS